jgi:hypothetical protein
MNFHELTPENKNAELGLQVRSATGLLSEDVCAAALDVEPSTLATWRSQGKGPDYVRLGKGVFYTISALSAWVNGELARQREARRA